MKNISCLLDPRLYCDFSGLEDIHKSTKFDLNSWQYNGDAISEGYEFTDEFLINIFIQLFLSVVSLLLNGLVISIILRMKKRNTGNTTLSLFTRMSLSVADTLAALCSALSTALLLMYSRDAMTENTWDMIVILTLLHGYFITTSFLHLIFMSIRRYKAITSPLLHINSSRRKFFIYLCLIWIPGLFPTVFTLYSNTAYFNNSQDEKELYTCLLRINDWLVLIVGYITPYVLTLISTCAMSFQYCRMSRARNWSVASAVFDRKRQKKDAKFVKMIMMIVCCYTLTCLPYIVQLATFVFKNLKVDYTGIIFTCPGTIMMANGIVDVLVYSIMDKNFRNQLKSMSCLMSNAFCRVCYKGKLASSRYSTQYTVTSK